MPSSTARQNILAILTLLSYMAATVLVLVAQYIYDLPGYLSLLIQACVAVACLMPIHVRVPGVCYNCQNPRVVEDVEM